MMQHLINKALNHCTEIHTADDDSRDNLVQVRDLLIEMSELLRQERTTKHEKKYNYCKDWMG